MRKVVRIGTSKTYGGAYQKWLRELLTRPEFEYDYATESWRAVE